MWIISPRSDDQNGGLPCKVYIIKRGFRYESVDHADRQMRLRNLEKKYKKITYD